jgi:hypothetical protein
MDILHDNHELAGKPLCEIGAYIRNKQSPFWRSVEELMYVRKLPFNKIRGPWKEFNEFGVQSKDE